MVLLKTAEGDMIRRGKIAEGVISKERPELINLFLTYQNEAIEARKFLERSLIELDSGAEILEIGGGILALGIQLAGEGFKVTIVEPVGEGFPGISYIMDTFIEIARKENLAFTLLKSPIEDCIFNHTFDFIYSINVMEHLKDPYSVLLQVVTNLRKGAKYRFFCPNYDFPYEPHFGKWIFARKNNAFHLTADSASRARIDLADIDGLYDSINFLTLRKLKFFLGRNKLDFQINKNAFHEILIRSITDSGLQQRHRSLYKVALLIEKLGLLRMAKLLPSDFQPIIDLSIIRTKV